MSSSETASDSQNSHSLNERKVVSKEDNYRRDSFDDRFCDDLCEEILQYLSLEDKLRLQCVSKQFQRTVFKRQYELYINVQNFKIYLNNIFRSDNNYYIEVLKLDSIKALLKKWPNITSIKLDTSVGRARDYASYKCNQVFQLIIENCNNLSEVIVLNDLNGSNFQQFYQKFGPKIKCLGTRYSGLYSKNIDLNVFPNIERLVIIYLHDPIFAQIKLPKLKQLEIGIKQGQEHLLQT